MSSELSIVHAARSPGVTNADVSAVGMAYLDEN